MQDQLVPTLSTIYNWVLEKKKRIPITFLLAGNLQGELIVSDDLVLDTLLNSWQEIVKVLHQIKVMADLRNGP